MRTRRSYPQKRSELDPESYRQGFVRGYTAGAAQPSSTITWAISRNLTMIITILRVREKTLN